MNKDLKIESYAGLSADMKYRYWLQRSWGTTSRPRVWIMLNPSTADADNDDPTIRRCIDFTVRDGNCSLIVVNLFAFRATEPKEMKKAADPVGPTNDMFIRQVCQTAGDIVLAWGNHGKFRKRDTEILSLLKHNNYAPVYCLGRNVNGSPKHPLYVKTDTPLERVI